jgi:hypothetical protein
MLTPRVAEWPDGKREYLLHTLSFVRLERTQLSLLKTSAGVWQRKCN